MRKRNLNATCPYYRKKLSWCKKVMPVATVDILDLDKDCDKSDNIFSTDWWPRIRPDDYCAQHPDF